MGCLGNILWFLFGGAGQWNQLVFGGVPLVRHHCGESQWGFSVLSLRR